MKPMRLGGATQIVTQQEDDILGALSKRWYMDLNDVQTELQILAEHTGFDALAQIAVGRRNEPYV